MDKKITVEITLSGLPDAPNHHRLSVELEEKINDAVALAIVDTYEHGQRGMDWNVRVPSF